MNADSSKDFKDISENEFKKRLREYSKKVERKGKVMIPNEPVGPINTPKPNSEF